MPETTTVQTLAPAAVADDRLFEVIDGRIVEATPMGIHEALIATTLASWIYQAIRPARAGWVVTEGLFQLASDGLKRRPDVAFVSKNRCPRRPVRGEAWDLAPDLAVEVVSPSVGAKAILGKLVDYFRAGARQVWTIDPDQAKLYVYTSPTAARILQPGDDLDGGSLIPGFRMPVKALFEDDDAPAA